jgi:microcystin-dependent protein
MARNGSGTFTPIITYVTSTRALAADLNSSFSDVATALTGSLAIDGQSTMTGQFKAADGSISAPGIGFGSDGNTGFYRSASGVIRASLDGTNSFTMTATGVSVAGTFSVTGAVTGINQVQTGSITEWGGTIASIPSGYLFCNGAAVSRTTYAALFAAIGTTHGAGDGSTTFNLPERRNVFPIGANSDVSSVPNTNITGSNTKTGGTKDAINVSHTHTASVTDPGHNHTTAVVGINVGSAYSDQERSTPSGSVTSSTATTGITVGISTEGSSGTNQNLPPYTAAVYMIKT